jgi:hypothetical protein
MRTTTRRTLSLLIVVGAAFVVVSHVTNATASIRHSSSADSAMPTAPAIRLPRLDGLVTRNGHLKLAFHGVLVNKLPPGLYVVIVSDRNPGVGFSLRDNVGAVLRVTGPKQVGRRSRVVKLTTGRWEFFFGDLVGGSFVVSD